MKANSLDNLITLISKLPGLGQRSAKRIALHLIKNKQTLINFSDLLTKVATEIKICDSCGNVDTVSPCNICIDPRREPATLCVVEDIADLWAMERGSFFKGRYHVLGGTLSALDGRTPDTLNFTKLVERVAHDEITEVIVATNATVEGQTTGFYILDLLKPFNIRTTRLANGIPVGAELDYMDEGTLTLALKLRQDMS
ncbi:MAG: recombination mediator RecR [Rickettsiales bacterium]